MMTARKRVRPLPTHRLAVKHSTDHSSSNSSSEASSDFHSDASSDSSSRHPLSDHYSPDLPSTSAGPSCKRRRFKDSGYLADVEVDPREISLRDDAMVRVSDGPHLEQDTDPEIQAEIDECIAYADALRDRGIDARVIVKGQRNIPDAAAGALSRRGAVAREQGHRIVGVELAVIALTERVAELERDNRRLRGTVSVESQRVDQLQRDMSRMQRELRQIRRLRSMTEKMPNTRSGASMTHEEVKELVTRQVAEETEAREAAIDLEPINENGDEQGNGNGGNGGNGNRGNGGNGNGRNRETEKWREMDTGMKTKA
ncbi:hypothetical protein Tco_1033197 [Tanacetum coccineum]|uniref:Uncharacterized protein n=1 Tax=Tanacetum coccineum TaxID=301880 RepID=A0ABQ5GEL5_9ASTR